MTLPCVFYLLMTQKSFSRCHERCFNLLSAHQETRTVERGDPWRSSEWRNTGAHVRYKICISTGRMIWKSLLGWRKPTKDFSFSSMSSSVSAYCIFLKVWGRNTSEGSKKTSKVKWKAFYCPEFDLKQSGFRNAWAQRWQKVSSIYKSFPISQTAKTPQGDSYLLALCNCENPPLSPSGFTFFNIADQGLCLHHCRSCTYLPVNRPLCSSITFEQNPEIIKLFHWRNNSSQTMADCESYS